MILKNINNIDVLYSLFEISNKQLEVLAQDDVYSNTFNSARMPSSLTDGKLGISCTYILRSKHYSIKRFIVESKSIKHTLFADNRAEEKHWFNNTATC